MTADLPVFTARDLFAARHIGPSAEDQRAMLAALGYATLDDLTAAALPPGTRPPASLATLPAARTEQEALAELRRIAARNTVRVSMIGQGYYGTITPPVIRRNLLENPAWYTAYTPYQPEISQGRLEALLNFQTMVADLTGLPVANASLLDEATAAAEAMTLARRVAGPKAGNVFLADADCLPQTLDVLRTRALPLGIDLRIVPLTAETDVGSAFDGAFDGAFGVLLQYPGASGEVRDLAPVIEAAHAAKRDGNRGRRHSGADAAQAPRRAGRRRGDRLRAAVRRADVLRRPARRLHGRPRGPAQAAARPPRRASRWTPTATPPTGWRCRRASSTSAARRPPATSAPPRCCSPWRPACTPATTDPMA